MIEILPRPVKQRLIAPRPPERGTARDDVGEDSLVHAAKPRIHTAQEWSSMYQIIRQLYVVENRKLFEVMVILDRHYGFKATQQMYKKRFTAWGLAKNRKGVLDTPRPAEQSDPRVQHACGREPHLIADRPLSGRSPPESALLSISNWTQGTFDSDQSPWRFTNQPWNVSGPGLPITYPSTRMYQDVALSNALLRRGKGHLAGMALRKAFYQLEEVIRVGDPGMMRNLVDTIIHSVHTKQYPLVRMFLRQLASLASHGFPGRHPLAEYFRQLEQTRDDLAEVLKRTYMCYIGRFQAAMNHDYHWMYDNWVWDYSVRRVDTNPEADYNGLVEVLQVISLQTEAVGPAVIVESHLTMLKGSTLMKGAGSSRTYAADILQTLQGVGNEVDLNGDPKIRVYTRTANIKHAIDRRDWDAARDIMRDNIGRLEAVPGHDIRDVVRELWSLEKVMRKAGNDAEADLIAEDALGRVNTYLSEVPTYVE